MSYRCRILLDSISETGKRITTFELTYPRIIHSEFMTHRMFSRNAASSRAIPAKRMREMVLSETFIPDRFPKNVAGMQPAEYFEKGTREYNLARNEWMVAANLVVDSHENLEKLGIHKQIANRLLEPFLWYTCVVTATEFDNFFKLRCDENAQYEIRRIADLMYEAYHIETDARATPEATLKKLKVGEWHCPLVSNDDFKPIMLYLSTDKELDESYAKDWSSVSSLETESWNNGSAEAILNAYTEVKKKISVARCARVSYLTHDGKRDIEKDLELFERLRTSGHWSPFEHVATPLIAKNLPIYAELSPTGRYIYEEGLGDRNNNIWSGNFLGFKQFRKEFQDENYTHFRKKN